MNLVNVLGVPSIAVMNPLIEFHIRICPVQQGKSYHTCGAAHREEKEGATERDQDEGMTPRNTE